MRSAPSRDRTHAATTRSIASCCCWQLMLAFLGLFWRGDSTAAALAAVVTNSSISYRCSRPTACTSLLCYACSTSTQSGTSTISGATTTICRNSSALGLPSPAISGVKPSSRRVNWTLSVNKAIALDEQWTMQCRYNAVRIHVACLLPNVY